MMMMKSTPTDHPIHDLIADRWSPRAFAPDSVPAETLRSLLEAARWAASSFNEQPWTFLVARREDEADFEKMLGCLMSGNRPWAENAGLLILTVARRTFTRNDRPNRTAAHDIGLAMGNLTLQATALDLWLHQMAGIELDRIRETYAIPEGHDPLTGIAVGYAGSLEQLSEDYRASETAPRERKPQEEFVFAGSWGTPAAW